MKENRMREDESYSIQHRRRIRKRIVAALACIVVFCTTYALILPAVTMENYACGMTEHTHTEACYTETAVSPDRKRMYIRKIEFT